MGFSNSELFFIIDSNNLEQVTSQTYVFYLTEEGLFLNINPTTEEIDDLDRAWWI